MNGFASFAMLHACVRWCGLVLNLFTQGLSVFVLGRRGIQRIGHTILLALPEMVHQQITSDACYPGMKCAAPRTVGIKSAKNLVKASRVRSCGVIAVPG